MPLKISTEERRTNVFIVKLAGRLDSMTSSVCEQKLQTLVQGGAHAVLLNLEKLDYISSLGLRVILGVRKAMAARKGRVALSHLQPQIAKVFELADILPQTSIFESVESADIFLDAVQNRELRKGQDVTD